jgi:hypothetical protein
MSLTDSYELLAGTRETGIIPRNQEAQLAETGISTQSKSISRRSKIFNVNGIEIKVKYRRISGNA